MLIEKKFAIYYREIPVALDTHLRGDPFIKFAKDGVKIFEDGHKCPRLSVIIEPCGNGDQDKNRVKKFTHLLDILHANNQIVGYSG